ncbi:hypothetical protein [Acetobacter sp.]|jgi:flagellar biosynthesis/type III secretory pathway protein FliH|uniref:hypothetical protein n=1 Tax=Acetobacter sp. TaxID=440 RepID=UPI0025B948AE|nr:hypothetical protein [Acetobacter sp.]MCH4091103.1 hypothetical protein [Acetobacter sp.]MCI1300286.1 hypothetical protein [Acetobacter sp.]MCI1316046.1 hypothetical protein [Acetobacter sp.]
MNSCIVLSGANKSGVLFAEDFDDISRVLKEKQDANEEILQEEPVSPPVPTYSQEDMDSAIAESVSKAIENTKNTLEEFHKTEIKRIEEENKRGFYSIFESINKDIKSFLKSYSENVSMTMLTSVVSAFPAWSDSQEKLWTPEMFEKIYSYFSRDFSICVKVHPDSLRRIKETILEGGDTKDDLIKFVEDSNMNRTDFEIHYSDGKISRDIDSIVSNILTDLSNSMGSSVRGEVLNG